MRKDPKMTDSEIIVVPLPTPILPSDHYSGNSFVAIACTRSLIRRHFVPTYPIVLDIGPMTACACSAPCNSLTSGLWTS